MTDGILSVAEKGPGLIEAIILGILQGLSEFLPISSTAHVSIAGKLMGAFDSADSKSWTAFLAVVQLGTLAAVLIYFSKDLRNISGAFLRENLFKPKKISNQSRDSKTGWMIILGSIPIVIVGFTFKKIIEGADIKDPAIIASSLILLAVALLVAERTAKFARSSKDLTIKDAIVVGLAQCLALIPGASRSGTTLTAGLFLGMKRDAAARFSFLLSIPAVLGSGLYEFYQIAGDIEKSEMTSLVVATVFAAISGYAAIAFLLKFLKTRTTAVFIIYRIAFGAAIFILIFKGYLESFVL